VRDALREEAEHLDEVGWGTHAQHFFNAADALDAFNEHARSERGRVGRLAAVCGASGAAAPAWLYKVAPAAA
jgi:hypothetical protein